MARNSIPTTTARPNLVVLTGKQCWRGDMEGVFSNLANGMEMGDGMPAECFWNVRGMLSGIAILARNALGRRSEALPRMRLGNGPYGVALIARTRGSWRAIYVEMSEVVSLIG
ncbi:hypothetical protein FGSG_13553 [Fusarium graminearum PH-1]|uniref:hypothetical protein n=1 Tax=Gibberella zeae (strain ATCC MYA-4620 / CBS 123657 / FGSC 9075 / NRRL 31084 / PH-1) TaxID=229533 RepID=UPI00021F213A|nr:hypothetical protein FGSG_13553 [Fusarium graminearum PH-1]ESU15876.1 hypothetical protein FGSG_13553 [Fusarium graminearum PH-1]|eukprot:XP_011328440.1 hypothetical protein FGSG_13553 [Fusarium graminearum PH-1]